MLEINRLAISSLAELNLVCIITILVMLAVSLEYSKSIGKQQDSRITAVALLYVTALISDTFWVIGQYADLLNPFLFYLFNGLYFLTISLASVVWFYYVCKELGHKWINNKYLSFLVYFPVLLNVVLCITAAANGLLFTANSNLEYVRGPLFLLNGIITYGYPVLASIFALCRLPKCTTAQETKQYRTFALFSVPVALFAGVQAWAGVNSACIGFLLSMIILFYYVFSSFAVGHRDEILELEAQEAEKEEFSEVVKALSGSFDNVYYIDTFDDSYRAYNLRGGLEKLELMERGHDFFEEARDNLRSVAHPADTEHILMFLRKKWLLDEIENNGFASSPDYRLVIDGVATYYHMRAVKSSVDDHHIIISVANVDKLVRDEQMLQKANVFSSYFVSTFKTAFYINLSDFSYSVYRSNQYVDSHTEVKDNYLIFSNSYIEKDVHPDDRKLLASTLQPDSIRSRLSAEPSFSVIFRDIYGGTERFFRCLIIRGEDENHAAVGFENVTEEYLEGQRNLLIKKQREELAKAKEEVDRIVEIQTEELREKNRELFASNQRIIELLGDIIELRDEGTGDHIYKVKAITKLLAKRVMVALPEYRLNERDVDLITSASTLHDVGKILIPDSILLKPGKLTKEEFDIMKTHSRLGCDVLERVPADWNPEYMSVCKDICLYHHERWDGRGYPEGLVGDSIPISAQIVAIADCFEALTSERPYKKAFDPEVALEMILNGECGQYSDKLLGCLRYCREELLSLSSNMTSGEKREAEHESALGILQSDVLVMNENTLPIVSRLSESMPGGFYIAKATDVGELVYFNDLLVKLFGCKSKEEFMVYTGNEFKGMIHPDDSPEAKKSILSQIQLSDEKSNHIVFRIIRKDDGEIRWLDNYGRYAKSDIYGDVYYNFVLDVTEAYTRKFSETANTVQRGAASNLDNLPGDSEEKVKRLDGIRVLVVDDTELTRLISREILEDEGASVTEAKDGLEALNLIKTGKYDLVLMELIMPVMNGVDTTREIRAFEKTVGRNTPVIALTSKGTDGLVSEVLKVGAYECLYKPLNISELSRVLLSHLREQSYDMEQRLQDAIITANTDTLTKVKSIVAYTEAVSRLSSIISNEDFEVGVVMCDIDNLKKENDTYGHDTGDVYIRNCCKLICNVFVHSPVFRIGGDEFAVILQGSDYQNAESLMVTLNNRSMSASQLQDSEHGKASISCGIAIYDKAIDRSISDVIKRADSAMFENKKARKLSS